MAAIPAPCARVECMRPAAQGGRARVAERRAVLSARPSGPALALVGRAGARGVQRSPIKDLHSIRVGFSTVDFLPGGPTVELLFSTFRTKRIEKIDSNASSERKICIS